MTGFGRGTHVGPGNASVVAEIRSVNNRFLDVTVRGSREAPLVEARIRDMLRQRLERGKVTVTLTMEGVEEENLAPDLERAGAYLQALLTLRDELKLKGEPDLTMLAGYRDILTAPPAQVTDEAVWEQVSGAVEDAVEALVAMRRREGEALQADLEARLEAISDGLSRIEERAPERGKDYADRMRARLTELLNGVSVDEERLLMELALYADRIDISEECTRLTSHIEQVRTTMEGPDSAGRRLNFLLQEMHREVNTLGSKANDQEIGYQVVAIKEELEKIREQVQNIE
jgi:uncharacterized protein (TIGR00255 family)